MALAGGACRRRARRFPEKDGNTSFERNLSKVDFRNVSSDKPAQAPAPQPAARRPRPPGAQASGAQTRGPSAPDAPAPDALAPDALAALAPDGLSRVPGRARQPEAAADASPAAGDFFTGEMGLHKITDARAMRALAHPLRLALLEALAHAGTLTATQASELLGESPANCAFHLRTLAKYGYVAEAGGGKGRERPWRRTHNALQITTDQEDPLAAMAADELGHYWLDMVLERARTGLASESSWPGEWRHHPLLGQSESILYVTPDEARELGQDIYRLLRRFDDRVDHPESRPAGTMPIETLLLSYPLLHLASWPVPGDAPQPPAGQPSTGQPSTERPPAGQPDPPE